MEALHSNMTTTELEQVKQILEKKLKECEDKLASFNRMATDTEGEMMNLSAAISVIDLELSGTDESDQS